jgi:hypothetical protein
MLIDKYFKYPVLLDLLISCFAMFGYYFFILDLNEVVLTKSTSVSGDLANVSLTSAGFILTLLTVLITFKSGKNITKQNYSSNEKVFNLFFASDLYYKTVTLLKNCIKVLILVAVIGYALRILLSEGNYRWLGVFNCGALTMIVLTLWRCLLILSQILKLQKENELDNPC